jgi:hypothetical protein
VRAITRELRDLLSLWLVPGLAAVLPWHWCVWIFWQLSRWRFLIGEEVGGSRGGRMTLGLDPADAGFDRRFRFGFLLEYADTFRTLTFGWRGLARTMPVVGDAERPVGGGLCFFFNFNQGLPALAQLRALGYDVYLVYRSLDQRPEGIGWVRYWSMRLRGAMVRRVCGNSGIGTGGARERIAQTVRDGGLPCVAADTPPRSGTGIIEVDFPGGRRAWWRSGILKLALTLDCPLLCFTVDLDWARRERRMVLRKLPAGQDLQALADSLADLFIEQWQREPALWFYWPAPQGFLQRPPDARVEPAAP